MGFTRPLLAALGIFASAAVATTESSNAAAIHDLGLLKWTVTNEHGNITVPGKFPSQAHLDLHAAGVIGKSRQHTGTEQMLLFAMLIINCR
jgi:beta-mannosidase